MTDIFTPKPFVEIVAGMVEHARTSTDRLTDFNVGSVVRSLLEANAIELDDYYQEVHAGLLRAIPTAVYIGFGFDLRAAVAARGVVRFVSTLDVQVALPEEAEIVSQSGAIYRLDDAVEIPALGSADVAATAIAAGAGGNADPETLSISVDWTFGDAVTATNPASMSGGLDAESEEQRAERFAAYIRALARGTVAALEYGGRLPELLHPDTGIVVERVQRASVSETPGHVDFFIHNGHFGASDALIAAVQAEIDGYRDQARDAWVGGWRPAGMRVDVQALTETPVSVSVEVAGPVSAAGAVRGAVERLLRAALPRDAVRPIDIVNAILAVDGVRGAAVLSPTQTLTVADNAILYLDDWSLTWVA